MSKQNYPLYYNKNIEEKYLVGDWFHNLFDLGNIFSQEIIRHNISKSLLSLSLPKLNFSSTVILLGIIKNIMSSETQDNVISKDNITNIEYGSFVKIKNKDDQTIIGKFLGLRTDKINGTEIKFMKISIGKGTEQLVPINQALERISLIEDSQENLKIGKKGKIGEGLRDVGSLHKYYLNSIEQNHLNKFFQNRFLIIGEKNKIKNEVLTKFFFNNDSYGYLSDLLRINELRSTNSSFILELISNRNKTQKNFNKYEYIILEGSNAIRNNLEITNMANVICLISPQETNYLDTVNLLNDFYQRHSFKKHEFEILSNLNLNIPAQLSIHE